MPFAPITATVDAVNYIYNQSGSGRYMRNDIGFGQPRDFIRMTAGSKNKGSDQVTAAIAHFREVATITPGGGSVMVPLYVQNVVTIGPSWTASDVDFSLKLISEVATVDMLNRLLSGES